MGFDTSFEPTGQPEPPGLEFQRRYLRAQDVPGEFDAVVCRHVIEHVPAVGKFLRELQAIAVSARARVVLLETPRFEWIARQTSVWDIFYEHCNYFPSPSLAYLASLAGFRLLRHRSVFGGQYQTLELEVATGSRRRIRPAPGITVGASLGSFAKNARKKLVALEKSIEEKAEKRPWAIWGAGAKGVSSYRSVGHGAPIGGY